MPFTTRRLPPENATARRTVMLPRGPNILAYLSLMLSLIVPAGVFFAGLAGFAVGFHLDFWPGVLAVLVAALTSVGAIYSGIGAVRHAAGSREPSARRGMALLGLGLGYLDAAALIAFLVWTVIRAFESIHLGG